MEAFVKSDKSVSMYAHAGGDVDQTVHCMTKRQVTKVFTAKRREAKVLSAKWRSNKVFTAKWQVTEVLTAKWRVTKVFTAKWLVTKCLLAKWRVLGQVLYIYIVSFSLVMQVSDISVNFAFVLV